MCFDFDDELLDSWSDEEEFNSKSFEKWFVYVLQRLLITLERKHGKYEKIFIRGKKGSVKDLRVGDWASFYDKRGACMTREVQSISKAHVELAPLMYKGQVLDRAMKTTKGDITEIVRPV